MSYVLINHGWTNTRQEGHWQRRPAITLRAQGHQVSYAQFPDTENPSWTEWSKLLVAELELLVELRSRFGQNAPMGDELILVGHSLGCVNIMKTALEGLMPAELQPDRVLLVAPPDHDKLVGSPETFRFDLSASGLENVLKSALGQITVVGSDADPWSPNGVQATYGVPLRVEPVIIAGPKHLSSADGWGPWQGVINWVNDPNSDLRVR